MGMAENCQARTPAVMRRRLIIGNRSITQIVCRRKPEWSPCDRNVTTGRALDFFPLIGSTYPRTGQSIVRRRCGPLWS